MRRSLLVAGVCIVVAGLTSVVRMRRPIDPTTPVLRDRDIHQIFLERANRPIGLLFIGDSITQRWIYRPKLWRRFDRYEPANFGFGGDGTEDVLGRIRAGELDGAKPRCVVLLIGTNDIGYEPAHFVSHQRPSPMAVAEGIRLILAEIRSRCPDATIVLMALLPRTDSEANRLAMRVNEIIRPLADGRKIRWLDIGPQITPDCTVDGLHLSDRGYEIWADALQPILDDAIH